MITKSQYTGEPAITGGDLLKQGGDYKRVNGLDNMILILVGTDSGYWGNVIENENSKIKGGHEKLDGLPITSSFLSRHSASIENLLSPLINQNIATDIQVESYNTENDRIDWKAAITLKDGSIYYYQTDGTT